MDIIIEDGYNTSYIISVICALFNNNYIYTNKLLNNNNIDYKYIYLQELIKENIVNKIKNNKYIFSYYINEIKNYLFYINFQSFQHIFQNINVEIFFRIYFKIF